MIERRGLYQFRLRSIFIGTGILCLVLALLRTWSPAAWLLAACIIGFWLGYACLRVGEAIPNDAGCLARIFAELLQAIGATILYWSAVSIVLATIVAVLSWLNSA